MQKIVDKIFLSSIALLVFGLVTLLLYGSWQVVLADYQIKNCYLTLDYSGTKTEVTAYIPWKPDVTLGKFDKYEDAEAAMARYPACQQTKSIKNP
jgi:hypothetical protein